MHHAQGRRLHFHQLAQRPVDFDERRYAWWRWDDEGAGFGDRISSWWRKKNQTYETITRTFDKYDQWVWKRSKGWHWLYDTTSCSRSLRNSGYLTGSTAGNRLCGNARSRPRRGRCSSFPSFVRRNGQLRMCGLMMTWSRICELEFEISRWERWAWRSCALAGETFVGE